MAVLKMLISVMISCGTLWFVLERYGLANAMIVLGLLTAVYLYVDSSIDVLKKDLDLEPLDKEEID